MANTLPLVFESTTFEVITRNDQPWLKAADLARALGYSRSDKITRLFERNSCEFTDSMTAVVETPTLGLSGNLVTQTRIFSLRGAHLLGMFARTAIAAKFRKWVLDVLEALPAPAVPVAIEYARISPAQAQHLKELVHLVVESGKQGHGETWASLHRKMKVNSYLELGADKFDEACQYLRGKMDDQSMSDLLKKHFPQPVPNIAACLAAANLAAAGVQQSIFEQLMSGKGDMENGRWMLSFATSRDNKPMPYVNQIESDAVVMSLAYLANALNEPGGMLPSNAELANLASACNRRLSDRFTNESSRRVSA